MAKKLQGLQRIPFCIIGAEPDNWSGTG